ncbi:MAG: pentapeptide repeat-containing protein, partial [Alphaproteobacteria bacterium]|nr:pentapeptide repeat-containing protein [Alphaproteobacteria bacterium]
MSTVKTFKFTIRSRWTGNPVFECDLEAKFESASEGVKLGAAVKMAIAAKADLSGADLRSAVLSGADLSGAVLRSADLSRA